MAGPNGSAAVTSNHMSIVQDRRVTIPKNKYDEVRAMHKTLKSYRLTGIHYGVCPRTIIYIVNPESYRKFKARHKAYRAKKKLLNNK